MRYAHLLKMLPVVRFSTGFFYCNRFFKQLPQSSLRPVQVHCTFTVALTAGEKIRFEVFKDHASHSKQTASGFVSEKIGL